jgi:hypothetical protein
VLIDQLSLRFTPQQHGKIIEPSDNALQLNAIDKEYRRRRLVLAQMVQKNILNVLRFIIRSLGHDAPLWKSCYFKAL